MCSVCIETPRSVERKLKSIFLLIGARFLTLRRPRLVNYGVKIGEANLLEKSVKRPSAGGEANGRNLVRLGSRSHGVHPPSQFHTFPFLKGDLSPVLLSNINYKYCGISIPISSFLKVTILQAARSTTLRPHQLGSAGQEGSITTNFDSHINLPIPLSRFNNTSSKNTIHVNNYNNGALCKCSSSIGASQDGQFSHLRLSHFL